MTSRLPVAVMMMSADVEDVVEGDDLVAVHRGLQAQIGSISVTTTRAPWPRSDSAQPLPTSP